MEEFLTLNMIAILTESRLVLQLRLVNNDIADSGCPVCSEAVVAGNPFCTNIGVNLY